MNTIVRTRLLTIKHCHTKIKMKTKFKRPKRILTHRHTWVPCTNIGLEEFQKISGRLLHTTSRGSDFITARKSRKSSNHGILAVSMVYRPSATRTTLVMLPLTVHAHGRSLPDDRSLHTDVNTFLKVSWTYLGGWVVYSFQRTLNRSLMKKVNKPLLQIG